MRVTVLQLLGLVALFALIVSAIAAPNERWLRLLGTATSLLIAVAAVTAVFRVEARPLAIGFLIGTSMYLVVAFASSGYGRQYLITDASSDALNQAFKLTEQRRTPSGETVHVLDSGSVHVSGNRSNSVMSYDDAKVKGLIAFAYGPMEVPTTRHLRDIVHFAWALLSGSLLGLYAQWLIKPRRPISS